jgi:hypothetical protein
MWLGETLVLVVATKLRSFHSVKQKMWSLPAAYFIPGGEAPVEMMTALCIKFLRISVFSQWDMKINQRWQGTNITEHHGTFHGQWLRPVGEGTVSEGHMQAADKDKPPVPEVHRLAWTPSASGSRGRCLAQMQDPHSYLSQCPNYLFWSPGVFPCAT